MQSSVIKPHPQTQRSKSKKSDSCQVYDNIIKEVMLDHSFKDSSNLEARHLHEKASMLVALALANFTKDNYGKAHAWYLDFCDKMGLDPMEAA